MRVRTPVLGTAVRRLMFATLAVGATSVLSAPTPGSYRLQDISGHGEFQFPTAINNAGVVTGFSEAGSGGGFVVSPQTGLRPIPMPSVPGSNETPVPGSAHGIDINARGEVAGTWGLGTGMRSYRYTPATGSRDLGLDALDARGITDAGRIVGTVFRENNRLDYFFAEPDGTVTTHVPPVTLWSVVGLRDDGVVVANRMHEASDSRRPVAGLMNDGVWQDLPLAGSLDSQAMGFNEHGVVVGTARIEGPQAGSALQHAFAFDLDAGWVDIAASMPGINAYSVASAINERGWVVGYGERGFGGDTFSFIHDLSTGSFLDMAQAVSPGTWDGWTNIHFTDINDVGQIVGVGVFNAEARAFLLSPTPPVPEPTLAALMLIGVGVVTAAARRRAAT